VQVDFKAFISRGRRAPSTQFETDRDTFSGLSIPNPGCVALDGNSALAFVRSRHREEFKRGRWRDAMRRLDRIARQQASFASSRKASASAGQNPLDDPHRQRSFRS
jgi:anionic cell wall polymer biosynthesis LytR-Cps2A-Psr (LCP) family protein